MNDRMKKLKRYFLSIPVGGPAEFTYYFNSLDGTTVATEFYYGTAEKVKVPNTLEGYTVAEVGSTTLCLGELHIDDFIKPDNRLDVTSVTIADGITKI